MKTAISTQPAAPAAVEPTRRIRLFKDSGAYKDDVFVAVNGRTFLIRRGVDVDVPACVAEVLERSMAQDAAAEETRMRLEADCAAREAAR